MLKRSGDRKVSGLIRTTAKSVTVKSLNSFGLPSGLNYSCPGATPTCERVCYAGKLEKVYKGVRNALLHNWEALYLASYADMVTLLSAMMQEFITESNRIGAPLVFRIHWDGDFFTADYARAWAEVINSTPDVQYWAYTRCFTPNLNVVPVLAGIPNLSLYLSVDDDNKVHAPAALIGHEGVRVATLAQTAAESSSMMESTTGKAITACPENVGKLPLVVGDKGACVACGLCVTGRRDVAFAIGKK